MGKTSYLNSVIGRNSYLSNKGEVPPTIGVEYAPTTVKLKNYNKTVQANIWDTCRDIDILAGAEKYKSITSCYYRKCQGVIIMFDVTDRKTFEHLKDWNEEVNVRTGSKMQKIVIGNKVDLVETGQRKREVLESEITDFCVENSITYMITSAITGSNIV